ncbi:MAG: hypothetical protein COA36_09945 [Desulfotalea sp.]|nr:MAG: hypothetical protein COA36_09945 [Desulfotalea sp.]
MKKYFVSAVLGFCLVVPAVSQSAELSTFEEKLSYSMGFEVGTYFKSTGDEIQKEPLVNGIEAAYSGDKPLLSAEEMAAVKKEYALKIQEKQIAFLTELKAKNHAAGVAFLEDNKKITGVTVTESGLQYEVLTEGVGDIAKAEDTVKVEYTGTLIDGNEFDSSARHGEAAIFKVGQVIKGWSEALQLMNPGAKLRLVIPAELAYGEQGVQPMIPPNSVLVFEVELKEIIKK